MGTLWQDVRYGLRILAKNPGFTAVVIVILAVAIGANTAIFSVINTVMLRPLPYEDSDRIVTFRMQTRQRPSVGTRYRDVSLWREQDKVFEAVAAYIGGWFYIAGIDQPHETWVNQVSANLFPLLGVQPLLGRGFLPEEEQPGSDAVVVVCERFWREHIGGDAGVLGKTLILNGRSHTIVGVMPSRFEFPFGRSQSLYLPLVAEPDTPVHPLGRLKKQVTLEQARAAMAVAAGHQQELDPQKSAGLTIGVDRLLDSVLEGRRRLPLLLWGAAGLVLLIACSNVANLFLARAATRQREVAMRIALGAGRMRVVRQMLTESLIVSLAAALVGLLLAFILVQGLVGLCPADIPRLSETRVDFSVLLFTLGISLLTGLLFGVMPACRGSDVRTGQMLKEGAVQTSRGRRWQHVNGGLVISQVALSLILLMGAGLLTRSLLALQSIDLGFRPENVVAMQIKLPDAKYPERHQRRAFFAALLERVRALPGVRSAAQMDWLFDMSHSESMPTAVSVPGSAKAGPEPQQAQWVQVSPGFFETMGIRLLKGRTFNDQDGVRNVIVDAELAHRCFGDADPVGQKITSDFIGDHTVVGVVDTTRDFLTPKPGGVLYARTDQGFGLCTVMVRTDDDPLRLATALRAQVASLDSEQVIMKFETVDARLSSMLAPPRFNMILVSLFAGIALIVAMIGVYGLLHYNATRQTRDIAIRMALGARSRDVLGSVLRTGCKLVLIGVGLGVAGAWAITRVLSSLLYDITATDPVTFIFVSVVLTVIALSASYIPARRAAKVDPMAALRCE
ncbi:MAG: ABC transporter permease [Sedimentisphaerales bacterium]|nr:ABC transporter permease [Sedimentisphaerales bacterium]